MKAVCSVGPVYLDINCLDFPFDPDDGLRPVGVTVGADYSIIPGGSAANFARSCGDLGVPTTLYGRVGEDPLAATLSGLLGDLGVDHVLVPDRTASTAISMNFVSPAGPIVMATAGTATASLDYAELDAFLWGRRADLGLAYFGGAFKVPQVVWQLPPLVGRLRDAGVRTMLDHGRVPQGTDAQRIGAVRRLARAVDYYMPSIEEFLMTWDAGCAEEAAATFFSEPTTAVVVLKSGSDGAAAYTRDGARVAVPAFPTSARNTVGAGDSFNAGFTWAVLNGRGLRASVEFACAAAALRISDSAPSFDLASVQALAAGVRAGY